LRLEVKQGLAQGRHQVGRLRKGHALILPVITKIEIARQAIVGNDLMITEDQTDAGERGQPLAADAAGQIDATQIDGNGPQRTGGIETKADLMPATQLCQYHRRSDRRFIGNDRS
jgi:hypothetical protein